MELRDDSEANGEKPLPTTERSCFYWHMSKGDETREAVLREALAQSSHVGLKGITIGGLAESTGLSKSGLFGHFRSKEQLQVDVLEFAAEHIAKVVVRPALKEPRGEPRVRALFERWLGWDGYADYALPGGCIFLAASTEFDDEPDGPVRDALVRQQQDMIASIETIFRTGVEAGDFRADADAHQFANDFNAIMHGYAFSARLLKDPNADAMARRAFERLLGDVRVQRPPDTDSRRRNGASRRAEHDPAAV